MKIHPTFLKIVNYMTGRSNLLGSTIDEWHAMGCPVVEEEQAEMAFQPSLRELELALAAANARIKELEENAKNSESIAAFSRSTRNEALEEAAKRFENDLGYPAVGTAIATDLRRMKK